MKRLLCLFAALLTAVVLTGCTAKAYPVQELIITENGVEVERYTYSYDENGYLKTVIKTNSRDDNASYRDEYERDEKGVVIAYTRVTDAQTVALTPVGISFYVYDLCETDGTVVRRVIFDQNQRLVSQSENGTTVEWKYDIGSKGLPKAIVRQVITPSGQAARTDYTVTITGKTTYEYTDPLHPEIVYSAVCGE